MPNYSQYLGCCCVKRLREFTRSKTFAIIQIGALTLSGYRCSGTMLVRPTIALGRSLLGMHGSLYLRTLNRGSIDKISFSACLNLDLALLYLPAGFLYNAV
jgi:hypothetical protein